MTCPVISLQTPIDSKYPSERERGRVSTEHREFLEALSEREREREKAEEGD
jgi:hypothetical protein